MFRGTLVYGVLLGIAAVSCAEAGVIGVNFTGGGAPLAATDQPGVVAGANWNNEIGGSGRRRPPTIGNWKLEIGNRQQTFLISATQFRMTYTMNRRKATRAGWAARRGHGG